MGSRSVPFSGGRVTAVVVRIVCKARTYGQRMGCGRRLFVAGGLRRQSFDSLAGGRSLRAGLCYMREFFRRSASIDSEGTVSDLPVIHCIQQGSVNHTVDRPAILDQRESHREPAWCIESFACSDGCVDQPYMIPPCPRRIEDRAPTTGKHGDLRGQLLQSLDHELASSLRSSLHSCLVAAPQSADGLREDPL